MKATIRRLLGGKSAKLAVFALPAIVAGTMIAAPAASAAQPAATAQPAAASSCAPGDLCFWVNSGYTGPMGHVAGNNSWWGSFSQAQCKTGTWSDCASSLYNHGNSDAVYVYQDVNYGGGRACLAKGTKWSNLTLGYFNNSDGLNDAISSNEWRGVAGCS
jgi:hypothetical protein